jgi:hypothetical protein
MVGTRIGEFASNCIAFGKNNHGMSEYNLRSFPHFRSWEYGQAMAWGCLGNRRRALEGAFVIIIVPTDSGVSSLAILKRHAWNEIEDLLHNARPTRAAPMAIVPL